MCTVVSWAPMIRPWVCWGRWYCSIVQVRSNDNYVCLSLHLSESLSASACCSLLTSSLVRCRPGPDGKVSAMKRAGNVASVSQHSVGRLRCSTAFPSRSAHGRPMVLKHRTATPAPLRGSEYCIVTVGGSATARIAGDVCPGLSHRPHVPDHEIVDALHTSPFSATFPSPLQHCPLSPPTADKQRRLRPPCMPPRPALRPKRAMGFLCWGLKKAGRREADGRLCSTWPWPSSIVL